MMTSAQVVETSVNVTSSSPSQDYTHPDDHNLPNYDMTPGFKPFTVMRYLSLFSNHWQLGSQNWQGASSTKEDCILICFIGLGTVTMATQLVVNQH